MKTSRQQDRGQIQRVPCPAHV
uniref:Uncharacterized protein n=1 Tax=Solanum tuberosum TaxID=4113 RepID=M1DRU9_SOLTU